MADMRRKPPVRSGGLHVTQRHRKLVTMDSLLSTPSGERVRIAFFGRRNVGKSSLLNAVAGQQVSIVSDLPGTTTDPVRKSMELLPLGPCVLVDTAGLDDEQETVGELRVKRTREELRGADIAVLVTDGETGIGPLEADIIRLLRDAGIAFHVVLNKADRIGVSEARREALARQAGTTVFVVSALTGEGVSAFRDGLSHTSIDEPTSQRIIGDYLHPGDHVVLVVPVDSAAPKGRLILPQQQTIRDILDTGATCSIAQVPQLKALLDGLQKPPRMVVTDSQAFAEVRAIVPQSVSLTSFSILFARYKGDYSVLKAGAEAVDKLRDGDCVLIAEGCTHRRQCTDIGTVKIPRWLEAYTKGKKLELSFTSGRGWPAEEELKRYALVIHCGACMLNRREMRSRITDCIRVGIPIVNYGVLIAKLRGVSFSEDL